MPFAETHAMEEKRRFSEEAAIAAFGALLPRAIDTGLVERLATSGWIDGGGLGQSVCRSDRAVQSDRPWATPCACGRGDSRRST